MQLIWTESLIAPKEIINFYYAKRQHKYNAHKYNKKTQRKQPATITRCQKDKIQQKFQSNHFQKNFTDYVSVE